MTKSNPRLSIIIPTWNTAEITLKCVETINKFLPHNFYEVIVVDNGSTDNTVSLLQNISPQVKLVLNYANLGFSKACNIGARHSRGELLLFLNSDMELLDDTLVKMVDFYLKTPDCGLIGPQFLNPDQTPQGSVFPPQTASTAFKEFWLNQSAYSKYTPSTSRPLSVWAISGGALLISRKLFKLIGGWNPKYFMYFEDLDLCRQVHRLHKAVYYFPQCRLIHRHGASGRHLADNGQQWRRLIPSAKLYFGLPNYYLINFIIWSGQKFHRLVHQRVTK